jgi:translocation and assembly module TamA
VTLQRPGLAQGPLARPSLAIGVALLLTVSGCGTFNPFGNTVAERAAGVSPTTTSSSAPTPSAASALPSAANNPGRAPLRLLVEAPDGLETLLRTHLDLGRLARDTAADALSDAELLRIQAATPSQARALLETEGYFDPKVTVARVSPNDPKDNQDASQPTVRVTVVPGPRAVVQTVKLDVQGELERAQAEGSRQEKQAAQTLITSLRDTWPLPEGAAFRGARWSDGKAAILARLRAEGFAAASWSGTAADVDAAANTVRLTLILDTGPRYRMGQVRIEGLNRQEEASVRNLMALKPGQPATEAALLDDQERLLRSGLYDRVSVTLDTDNADPAGTPVIVRVQEAQLQQGTVGVGISANTGPRIALEHTHRRVFGERATSRNKLELGRLRQAWDGELSSHAQPDLYRNLVGGAFERLVANDDSDTVRSARLRLGRTRETSRQEHLTFFQLERADRTTRNTAGTFGEGITALSINHHAVWRNVDNVLLPTQGASLSLQSGLGYARGDRNNTVANNQDPNNTSDTAGPYGRLLARINLWQPLGAQWYGLARVELGQVFVRNNLAVPQTQLFRAGGDDSVRGYAYRSLGPLTNGTVGGGRVLATGSVEVARPVSERLPTVWWAVFADAGQAATAWGDLKPVWGAGVGVRWRSPVGPLSVDWAWGDATKRSRLHLSVGVVF